MANDNRSIVDAVVAECESLKGESQHKEKSFTVKKTGLVLPDEDRLTRPAYRRRILFYRLCEMLYFISQLLVYVAYWYTSQEKINPVGPTSGILYLFFGLMLIGLIKTLDRLPSIERNRYTAFLTQFIAITLASVIISAVEILVLQDTIRILLIFRKTAVQVLLIFIWVFIESKLIKDLFFPPEFILIYEDIEAYQEMQHILKKESRFWPEKVIHICDQNCDFTLLLNEFGQAKAVMLVGISCELKKQLIRFFTLEDINILVHPSLKDVILSNYITTQIKDVTLYCCNNVRKGQVYEAIKRIGDLVISLIALFLLSPILLIVAVVIKLEDGGPVIYRQKRLTKGGREFTMYKFRTMIENAEEDGAQLSRKNDPRITKVGSVLRRFRLDECPQFINILKGEMSLVGPRPERAEFYALYKESLPEFSLRLRVRAGLTGYAQIYGKYNTKPIIKLKMDLVYIANRSLLTDLNLLILTLKIIFRKESAEGVENIRGTTRSNEVCDQGNS